jgi:hypothetical protein
MYDGTPVGNGAAAPRLLCATLQRSGNDRDPATKRRMVPGVQHTDRLSHSPSPLTDPVDLRF